MEDSGGSATDIQGGWKPLLGANILGLQEYIRRKMERRIENLRISKRVQRETQTLRNVSKRLASHLYEIEKEGLKLKEVEDQILKDLAHKGNLERLKAREEKRRRQLERREAKQRQKERERLQRLELQRQVEGEEEIPEGTEQDKREDKDDKKQGEKEVQKGIGEEGKEATKRKSVRSISKLDIESLEAQRPMIDWTGHTISSFPPKPEARWTPEQLEMWEQSQEEASPFRELWEKYDAGGVSEKNFYKSALEIQGKLNAEIQERDKYFIENYMKPDPAEEFESSITSQLSMTVSTEEAGREFPQTEESKRRWLKRKKQEEVKGRRIDEESLEKRLQALEDVKRQMQHTKYAHACHREERERRRELENERIAKKLEEEYGINAKNLPPNSEIFNRYRQMKHEKSVRERAQVERRIEILRRLLAEEKKTYNDNKIYQVSKTLKILPIQRVPPQRLRELQEEMQNSLLEEVESKTRESLRHKTEETKSFTDTLLTSLEEEAEEEEDKYEEASENTTIGSNQLRKADVKQKQSKKAGNKGKENPDSSAASNIEESQKGKTTKKGGKSNKDEGKSNKDETEAGSELDKEQEEEDVLTRERVEPQNMLLEEIQDLVKWSEKLEEYETAAEVPTSFKCLENDKGFYWKPNSVNFKDFKPGRIYRQKIVITNVSSKWLSCRLEKIDLCDDMLLEAFEFNNLFSGRICAGLSFDFLLAFHPTLRTKEVVGEIVFNVQYDETPELKCFSIPLYCNAKLPDSPIPKVVPQAIKFRDVPEWQTPTFKILKLINVGFVECIASITKAEPATGLLEEIVDSTAVDIAEREESVINQSDVEQANISESALKLENASSEVNMNGKRRRSKKGSVKKDKDVSTQEASKTDSLTIQESNTSEETAEMAIKEIIEECLNNVYDIFHFEKMYHITVPSKSTIPIQVALYKQPPGMYSKEYIVRFEDKSGNCVSQVLVPVSGTVVPFPLTAEPVALNFHTCFMDGGVYQSYFTVYNSSLVTMSLWTKVPQALRNHAQILPFKAHASPHASVTFTVRLAPKFNIAELPSKYYDRNTEVLDFPAIVQPSHQTFGQCPTLSVQILAVVTSPHALELHPPECNLGTVSTLETVCKVITLTNRSKGTLQYFFPKTPPFLQVQPNFGLGTIQPGTSRELHLLYSPRVNDIEGNDKMHSCGLAGFHNFKLKVVSTQAQAGFGEGPRSLIAEAHYSEQKQLVNEIVNSVTQSQLNPETRDVVDDTVDTIFSTLSLNDRETSGQDVLLSNASNQNSTASRNSNVSQNETNNHSEKSLQPGADNNNGDHIIELKQTDEFSDREKMKPDNRIFKNIIHCKAYVIDPLCELSETHIVLPPTPCGSYSMHDFYLRGENISSPINCQCGILPPIGQHKKKFCAKYQFHSSNAYVTVEPMSGKLLGGQTVKATLIFKPLIQTAKIEKQARFLKEHWQQEAKKLLEGNSKIESGDKINEKGDKTKKSEKKQVEKKKDDNIKSKEKLDIPKKGKARKKSIKEQQAENLASIEISPEDLFPAEKSLLETLEPYTIHALIKCFVQTSSKIVVDDDDYYDYDGDDGDDDHGVWRCEVHRMEVVCPVVKPDFLIRCNSQHLDFGPVAVGTKERMILKIHNITMENISVSLTLLNPIGPFFCPTSVTVVAPEHVLALPVTFSPDEELEEVSEFFEIHSRRTFMPMMVSGSAVTPEYQIAPDFLICRFEGFKGDKEAKTDKCSIEVLNQCCAPLRFTMKQIFVKEAEDRPPTPEIKEEEEEEEEEREGERGKIKKEEEKGKRKKGIKDAKTMSKSEGKEILPEKHLKRLDKELDPDEQKALEKYFVERDGIQTLFEAIGDTDTNEIVVPAFGKGSFTVQFCPQDIGEISESESPKYDSDSSTPRKKDKKENKAKKKDRKEEKKMQYIAQYELYLGTVILVQNFFFIAKPHSEVDESKTSEKTYKKNKKNKK